MPSVIAFDCETWLIEPGLKAPPLVCLQWLDAHANFPMLEHRDRARTFVEEFLDSDALLVGHNVAFDMAVICAQWPDFIPAVFRKYDRDQITDSMIREQLIMISKGWFKFMPTPNGEALKTRYSLADCTVRHFGRSLKKEGWRLFYRAFDDCPDVAAWDARAEKFQRDVRGVEWVQDCLARGILQPKDIDALLAAPPWEAREYALTDATTTLELYESQETFDSKVFRDQFRQARAAFALHLSSCWGLYTDPDAVDKLEADLRAEFDDLQKTLQTAGLIRENGVADTLRAKEAMVEACDEEGLTPLLTKNGAVSLGAEACDRFDDDTLIGQYSTFQRLRKTLSNDIKMLRAGCDAPVQPSYGLADTGRTTCHGPNIQAINRGAGIREAFRPRPGFVFIQADFEGLELHTFAAWCLEKIGWSHMADALNAGQDVHLSMAAEIIGITYEEALVRKKDPIVKDTRQLAKAVNFGRPGGMGDKKFIRYAKNSWGVDMTAEQARESNRLWRSRFPEVEEYFRIAAVATNNPDRLADEEHLFTGRIRGNVRYSALCNGRFQGLGADAAKEALWRVTRACYSEPASPLYGCRPVAFVHDEIIAECPDDERMPAAAAELGRLMIEGANMYLGKVPVRLTPLAMRAWSKSAEPTYDADGQLIPWEFSSHP
jgi:DNA polymerase-1